MEPATYTLRITCADRPGLVAAVAEFLVQRNGNILSADQHVDREQGLFLQRIEFTLPTAVSEDLSSDFARVADRYEMTWNLRSPGTPRRVGILTSRESHCLSDLLSRWGEGEMGTAELCFVASNHPDHKELVGHFGIPFHHIPTDPAKPQSHTEEVQRTAGRYEVDLLILARYMQILPGSMVDEYENKIINIHHSFLPAFAGAKPYHQAHSRGVKLIGATAHYVTADLDEGPIIAQDVLRVSHRDGVDGLRQKGRDLEKVVLARAVRLHLSDRVLAYGNRTAVFD